MKWDSNQYLKFQDERTQPAIDLANRIRLQTPKRAIDLGCGPGNSTVILKAYFPDAEVIGVDSSENMIQKARQTHPDISFEICDLNSDLDKLTEGFDIVFSNACLQWVPNHRELLPKLYNLLNPGGILAVQIPKNWDSPLYRAMNEVIDESKWGFDNVEIAYNGSLEQSEYYDLLSSIDPAFSIWETIYYHSMADHRALVEWIKGTKLRPYLNVLSEEKGECLMNEIVEKTKPLYPVQQNGKLIYQFRRLFFTIQKS
ncbi:MAG: methyltransferase domain-containing protein [Lachnospiraceae bacterium]|nr:methyltransferase domain-containing protein [Lachnospiraceae bacterium]